MTDLERLCKEVKAAVLEIDPEARMTIPYKEAFTLLELAASVLVENTRLREALRKVITYCNQGAADPLLARWIAETLQTTIKNGDADPAGTENTCERCDKAIVAIEKAIARLQDLKNDTETNANHAIRILGDFLADNA